MGAPQLNCALAVRVLVLVALAAASSVAPCDDSDPKALCLSPLEMLNAHDEPAAVRMGGGAVPLSVRAASSRRRPFRRPGRRPGGIGGGDDDDDDGDDDDDDDDDGDGDDDQAFGEEEEEGGSNEVLGSNAEGESDLCFPAAAVVNTRDRGRIRMHEVRVGDAVQVAARSAARYSHVFTFSHREASRLFPFKRLLTERGALEASGGHYVYTNNALTAAQFVRPGDQLQLADTSFATVLHVRDVWRQGLYNPHTVDGELVVDGFRVSSYTTSVKPSVAAALLAPVRAVHQLLRVDMTAGVLQRVRPRLLLQLIPSGRRSVALAPSPPLAH